MMHSLHRTSLAMMLAALAMLAAAAARADTAALYAAAKKEGEVVWYTSQVQNTLVRPVAAAFQRRYPGVKVTVVGGKNADLLLKLLAEAKAGVYIADVKSPGRIDRLDEAGLLATYTPESARDFTTEFRSAKGKWTAMFGSIWGSAINTELVKPQDEPKTLDDYLLPRWKGKMAWVAHYDLGGGPGLSEAILYQLGREKGMVYLRRLAEQKIVQVPANQRVIMDQLIAGEFPMALMMFQHHAALSIKKGAPVKWLASGALLSSTATIVLMNRAPHPNAGRLLVDFVVSKEGQEIIARGGYPPVRSDVLSDKSVMTSLPKDTKALRVTPETSDEVLEAGIKVYRDIFR